MSCDEYRDLLVRAMRGEVPTGLPQAAFQLHFADCRMCQLLLDTDDIAEALARVASAEPPSEADAEIVRQVESRIRRRRRRALVLVPAAAALLVVGVGLSAGWLESRPDPAPFPYEEPANVPSPPSEVASLPEAPISAGTSPEERAPQPTSESESPPNTESLQEAAAQAAAQAVAAAVQPLDTEAIRFWRSKPTGKTLMLDFLRRDSSADAYAFAQSAALAGLPHVFSGFPDFVVTVLDEEKGSKKVFLRLYLKPGDAEPDRKARLARLSPVEFCRLFAIADVGGKTKTSPEGEK